ncbi:Uncharacterised protein [Mycobacterium tuberculosis]|nr:Uncharacterised protein [Mycobacterium tuberculosis]
MASSLVASTASSDASSMPQSASTFRTNRRASATAAAVDGKVAEAVCRSNRHPLFEASLSGPGPPWHDRP